MSMRFLHSADIHFRRETQEQALASLTVLAETAEREKPALVALAGDLFDAGVQNSAASGFPRLLAVIQRILDVCPIAAVSGTPTHDLPGCYEALTKLRGKDDHNFVMIQPGKAYYKDTFNDCIHGDFIKGQTNLMILGMPEAGKEWFLAGSNGLSAEEANQKVIEGMRGILLGLGAIRAQHPEIPCVMLYHGAVTGATMANGQLVEGGISIGREDLALVGADYYALGHIHLAQQIPGLPAYYPGSAYPVNWGEVDQKGFNLVEFNLWPDADRDLDSSTEAPDPVTVTRVPFPHPPRKKIVVELGLEEAMEGLHGFQIWLVVRKRKDAAFDETAALESLYQSFALPGSRVTVEVIPTETVRAAEITQAMSLRHKYEIWTEASEGEVAKLSVAEKADQLEREGQQLGFGGSGHHLRLRRSRVRGHIAHYKRLGVDEVTLDLEKFGPGLIALTGPNGTGKTALAENSHLFPCEWSEGRDRKGGLKDNFRLRDSVREVLYDDPRTGDEYRGLIQIDGVNASGGVECHLSCKLAGADWEPLTDGRMASYLAEIEKLAGSKTMFLRSAFWTQEPSDSNPRIRRATKGQKKTVFSELAGVDYLQAYSENAKGKAGVFEAEITTERARINLIESQLTALPGIIEECGKKHDELGLKAAEACGIKERGEKLRTETDALAKKVKDQEVLQQRIAGLEEQAEKKRQEIQRAEGLIQQYETARKQQPLAQKVIATWEQLKEQESKENERIAGISRKREDLTAEYGRAQKAHSDACREIEGKRSALRTKNASLAGDRNVLQAQIEHLKESLTPPKPCPQCGYIDPEITKKRAESEAKLTALQQKHAATGKQIAEIDAQLAAITLPDAPFPPELPPVDQAELQSIRGALAALDIEKARKDLATAQEAATRLEETRKQRESAKIERNRLNVQILDERAEIDVAIGPAYDEALSKLEAARHEYQEAAKAVAALEAQIKGMDQRISELKAQEKDLGVRKTTVEEKAADAAEWRLLERATGVDGIQALELDAMGPGIAEEANKLLSVLKDYEVKNHYDQIRFETTRIAGKGSKTHQIEDFTIYCHDTEHDDWVDFALVSVGEAVWIDTALMDAFGIIRDRNSGNRSLTQFRDESDAALDAESRRAYFAMLQAAHDASGRYQTVVVTHSPEAQETIAQKIAMEDLVVTPAVTASAA